MKARRLTALALVAVAILPLTACGEDAGARDIRLGKECADAGGEWVRYADGWGSGVYCRFEKDGA